jgi:hypothetical protein
MGKLKKCPCGRYPESLFISQTQSSSWGEACGNCCGEWNIEFRSVNHDPFSKESYERAIEYWNDMPRDDSLI